MKDLADMLELLYTETNSNYQLIFQVIVQLSVVPKFRDWWPRDNYKFITCHFIGLAYYLLPDPCYFLNYNSNKLCEIKIVYQPVHLHCNSWLPYSMLFSFSGKQRKPKKFSYKLYLVN